MKKILFPILITMVSFQAYSQTEGNTTENKFSLGVFSNISTSSSSGVIGFNNSSNSAGGIYNSDGGIVVGSLGAGFTTGLTASFKINKYLSLEMGLAQLKGTEYETTSANSQTDFQGYTNISKSTHNFQANQTQLRPGLKMQIPIGKIGLYSRIGLVSGYTTKVEDNINYSSTSTNPNISAVAVSQKFENNSGKSLGYFSEFWLDVKLGKLVSFNFGASLVSSNYNPAKGNYTEYTVNGVDAMSTLKTSEKEFVFYDSYNSTIDYNQPIVANYSSPTAMQAIRFPFSSAGLTFGLSIGF